MIVLDPPDAVDREIGGFGLLQVGWPGQRQDVDVKVLVDRFDVRLEHLGRHAPLIVARVVRQHHVKASVPDVVLVLACRDAVLVHVGLFKVFLAGGRVVRRRRRVVRVVARHAPDDRAIARPCLPFLHFGDVRLVIEAGGKGLADVLVGEKVGGDTAAIQLAAADESRFPGDVHDEEKVDARDAGHVLVQAELAARADRRAFARLVIALLGYQRVDLVHVLRRHIVPVQVVGLEHGEAGAPFVHDLVDRAFVKGRPARTAVPHGLGAPIVLVADECHLVARLPVLEFERPCPVLDVKDRAVLGRGTVVWHPIGAISIPVALLGHPLHVQGRGPAVREQLHEWAKGRCQVKRERAGLVVVLDRLLDLLAHLDQDVFGHLCKLGDRLGWRGLLRFGGHGHHDLLLYLDRDLFFNLHRDRLDDGLRGTRRQRDADDDQPAGDGPSCSWGHF